MRQDDNALIVEPLAPAAVRTAYPLLQSADATIGIREWLRYARAIVASHQSRRGVLVARRRTRAHPCGAVCWRIERHPTHGALLIAEYLIALDLVDPQAVAAALIAAVNGIARTRRCGAIRAMVPIARQTISVTLREAGHSPELVAYSRILRG